MRLIDADNIDFVILEDSLNRIEHKKGDEVDCVIGANEVKAIPIEKLEQARAEMESKLFKGISSTTGFAWENLGINICLEILDKLIKSEVEE